MTEPADRITEISSEPGEKKETNKALFNLVYEELHHQAHRYLQKERRGHTLQTTALVHEAYLILINQKKDLWESRAQFFKSLGKILNIPRT